MSLALESGGGGGRGGGGVMGDRGGAVTYYYSVYGDWVHSNTLSLKCAITLQIGTIIVEHVPSML